MSAFKQFLSQDIIVEPFKVNKGFSFLESEFTNNDVNIDRFEGVNNTLLNNIATTGNNNDQYKVLIYSSIKELYYSNFISSSYGSPVSTQSLFPGDTEKGDVFTGTSDSSGRYENYLQSTLTQNRFIPTGSGDRIAVFSIPSRLFGDYIQPKSFIWEDNTNNVIFTDDGEGNIIASGSGLLVNGGISGNIIYQHGIVTLTDGNVIDPLNINDFPTATNVTCSFSSSLDIYETQYKATINEFEYNFSQNPSIISGSTDGTIYNFATGSYFSPYATTVGLYDDNQNLLAVGKLSQPLPISRTTDTSIFINIDR
jgi:hypothetical protein